MVVLDDSNNDEIHTTDRKQSDDARKTSTVHIIDIEDSQGPATFRKHNDWLLWILVVFGIFMFFPVGFVALYFIYTARIFYYAEHTEKAKSHAQMAKLLSLIAVVLGMLWLGLLIGLSAWG